MLHREDIRIEDIRTSDVTAVKVQLPVAGYYYEASGSAKRDESDRYDEKIAEGLAYGRALRQLGREILRDAQDRIRDADRIKQRAIKQSQEAKERRELRAIGAEIQKLLDEMPQLEQPGLGFDLNEWADGQWVWKPNEEKEKA